MRPIAFSRARHSPIFRLSDGDPIIVMGLGGQVGRPSFNHLQMRPDRAGVILPADDRLKVGKLAALLRRTDGVDAGHVSRVRRVTLGAAGNLWRPRLLGEGDLAIERWSPAMRCALFRKIAGVDLQIA